MATRFKRLDGENMTQFQARIAAIQAAERKPHEHLVGRSRKRARIRCDQRAADRIDGYDRDNLGESPDF